MTSDMQNEIQSMANNITVSMNAETLSLVQSTLRDIMILVNEMEPKDEEGE